MQVQTQCPQCHARYEVSAEMVGAEVRCLQCKTSFQAASMSEPSPYGDVFSSPAGAAPDLGNPLLSGGTLAERGSPSGPAMSAGPQSGPQSGPDGPSDAKMRLASAGSIGIGLLLVVITLAMDALVGMIVLNLLALAPLLFVLGIAGLISPNVVRSLGKYGSHLSWGYRATGWSLIGLSIVLGLVVVFGAFLAGYRPNVPRPRRRRGVARAPLAQPPVARPAAAKAAGAAGAQKSDPPANGILRRKSYPVTISVPGDSMRVPADMRLSPGTPLEACYFSKWNPITLLRENPDGTLNVRWDDYGPRYDCSMVRDELIIKRRRPPAAPAAVAKKPPAAPVQTGAGGAPSVGKPVTAARAAKRLKKYPVTIAIPEGSQAVPADARLKAGARLQACWAGKWNPITFLAHNADGTLTVRWDDFGPSFDCRMARSELIISTAALGR